MNVSKVLWLLIGFEDSPVVPVGISLGQYLYTGVLLPDCISLLLKMGMQSSPWFMVVSRSELGKRFEALRLIHPPFPRKSKE